LLLLAGFENLLHGAGCSPYAMVKYLE